VSNSKAVIDNSEATLRFLLLFTISTVFNVVCDWKPLATVGMKCQGKLNSFNGIWGVNHLDLEGYGIQRAESPLRHHKSKGCLG
jgi:hypothetical protein